MATHPDYPGLEVSIRANNQNLQEHPDPAAKGEPGVVTRYVLANHGLRFRLQFGLFVPFPSDQRVRILTFIDGTLVTKCIWEKAKIERRIWFYHNGKSYNEGEHRYRQHYQFANIVRTTIQDNEAPKSTDQLGTIVVQLEFETAGEKPKDAKLKACKLPEQQNYSEKDLKGDATSLQVVPVAIQIATPQPTLTTTRIAQPLQGEPNTTIQAPIPFNNGVGPFATFIFKDRSRGKSGTYSSYRSTLTSSATADLEELGVLGDPPEYLKPFTKPDAKERYGAYIKLEPREDPDMEGDVTPLQSQNIMSENTQQDTKSGNDVPKDEGHQEEQVDITLTLPGAGLSGGRIKRKKGDGADEANLAHRKSKKENVEG